MEIFGSKKALYGITLLLVISVFFSVGCAPLLVGAGAAGGYIIASDDRSVGQTIDDGVITAKIKSKSPIFLTASEST